MLATAPCALGEQAYRQLRRAIVGCRYLPGERLRVEELSRDLGISNSPVREALNRLVQTGLVRWIGNRGFRVAPLTVAGVADLTRVRLLVECQALADSLERGGDAWEAGVVGAAHALGRSEERLGDGPLLLDPDWSGRHREFHLSLYAACGSPLLLSMAEDLFDAAERYRQFSARHRDVPRRKNAEHQRLMAAAIARDREKAIGLLRQHVSGTERNVVRALRAAGAPS